MLYLFSINILHELPILTSLTKDENTFVVLDLKKRQNDGGVKFTSEAISSRCILFGEFLNHILKYYFHPVFIL